MPPIWENIITRSRGNSGLLEYRFTHGGKQLSAYGYSNKECWEDREKKIAGKGRKQQQKQIYVGDWTLRYYNTYKRQKNSERTNRMNEYYINEICKAFPKTPLIKATADDIQMFINKYSNKKATQEKIYKMLKGAFRKAYTLRHIKFNPFDAVEYETPANQHYAVIQPNLHQFILNNIKLEKYKALFLHCCCTGLRISEFINALPHIDFENGIINVVDEDKKTKKHRREVPFLVDRMFTPKDMKLLTQISLKPTQHYFRNLFKRLKIKAVVHSFRVTFISCCNHIGINVKQIQEWAGHTSAMMTLDTYAKLIKNDETSPILSYLRDLKQELNI